MQPVFKFFRNVAHILLADPERSLADDVDADGDERRENLRFAFQGKAVPIRSRGLNTTIHIKDLSCGGVCGVTAIPVAVGGTVVISLPGLTPRTAEVRWVRNTTMGLKFDKPLKFSHAIRLGLGSLDSVRLYRPEPATFAGTLLAANDS